MARAFELPPSMLINVGGNKITNGAAGVAATDFVTVSQLGGGGPPTGAAGGALAGTYPNPDLAAALGGNGLAFAANVLSVNVDGTTIAIAADTLSVPTGGIGPTQLASTAVTPGTYGGAASVGQFTVDADGRLTAASNVSITGTGGVAGADGWVDDSAETWTFASATTFTVTGDLTTKYTVGTKLKLTQTTVKYFVVTAVAVAAGTTTVTLTGGSDYTFANAAVSANFHSYVVNPQGWPGWFNWSSTGASGWAAGATVTWARFNVQGRICIASIRITGTSNATSASATAPIASANNGQSVVVPAVVVDNGASPTTPGRCLLNANSSTLTFGKDYSGANFTNTGTKTVATQIEYEI